MKKIILFIIFFSSLYINSAAYDEDTVDFYVQGQDIQRSLRFINNSICFTSNNIAKGALINDGNYVSLVDEALCNYDVKTNNSTDGVLKSGEEEESNSQSTAEATSYAKYILNVTRASNTTPLRAKSWAKKSTGSTSPETGYPSVVFGDMEISKIPCTATITTNCNKLGTTTFNYSYTADGDWGAINSLYAPFDMTKGKTIGMGYIKTDDNSLAHVAHQGAMGANISLTISGDNDEIIKGIYELQKGAFFTTYGWPTSYISVGKRFYTDYARKIHCEKFEYANYLDYYSSNYNFMDTPKRGPAKRNSIDQTNSLITFGSITDVTAEYQKNTTMQFNPWDMRFTGAHVNEACVDLDKTNTINHVWQYGVYTQAGERFDLENKAMNLVATPSSSGADFENMYTYASEHGVYLEHRYRGYTTASTQWKNNSPSATEAQKAKTYTLKQNFLKAEKYSTKYISLEDTHKQEVNFHFNDPHWDTQFKNLGFCGTDGLDKDGNACTPVESFIGYYDKNLEIDGNSATKGGYVFDTKMNCSNSCVTSSYTNEPGSAGATIDNTIKKFENSQWLSTMIETHGSYTHVRWLHMWNRDQRSGLNINKTTLENPSDSSSANGLRIEKHEVIPISSLPATLHCLERCIDPDRMNSALTQLITEGQTIATIAALPSSHASANTQNWACSNGTDLGTSSASCTTSREAAPTAFADVGEYIKPSETNSDGHLEYDGNKDGNFTNGSNGDHYWQNADYWGYQGVVESDVVTYTVDTTNSTISLQGGSQLNFTPTISESLNQIASARGFFRDYSGSARTKIRDYSDNVDYHLWMNRLVDDATLAKLECNKQYSVYDSSNADEYEYRPGWNQAKNAEKRYCGSKHYDPAAEVLTTYSIQIRNEPTYDLIDTSTNAVVEFSSRRTLILEIPEANTASTNYPTSELGKKYRLDFNGFGHLHGIPYDVWDLSDGTNKGPHVSSWENTYRTISRFIMPDGTTLTDAETGTTYKVKALRGEAYLKGKSVDSVKGLLGVTEIPYDNSIAITGIEVLKDLSTNDSTNTIGAIPTDLINEGEPCVVDGAVNASCVDSTN